MPLRTCRNAFFFSPLQLGLPSTVPKKEPNTDTLILGFLKELQIVVAQSSLFTKGERFSVFCIFVRILVFFLISAVQKVPLRTRRNAFFSSSMPQIDNQSCSSSTMRNVLILNRPNKIQAPFIDLPHQTIDKLCSIQSVELLEIVRKLSKFYCLF